MNARISFLLLLRRFRCNSARINGDAAASRSQSIVGWNNIFITSITSHTYLIFRTHDVHRLNNNDYNYAFCRHLIHYCANQRYLDYKWIPQAQHLGGGFACHRRYTSIVPDPLQYGDTPITVPVRPKGDIFYHTG